jgi:hypothetical protein
VDSIKRCPICRGVPDQSGRTKEGREFHCERCDKFEVTRSALVDSRLKLARPERRREILECAKRRASNEGGIPKITTDHLRL